MEFVACVGGIIRTENLGGHQNTEPLAAFRGRTLAMAATVMSVASAKDKNIDGGDVAHEQSDREERL